MKDKVYGQDDEGNRVLNNKPGDISPIYKEERSDEEEATPTNSTYGANPITAWFKAKDYWERDPSSGDLLIPDEVKNEWEAYIDKLLLEEDIVSVISGLAVEYKKDNV